MSFRCAICGKAQDSGTKPVPVVTKKRQALEARAISIGSNTAVWREPWEIVEEKLACISCAEVAERKEPEVVQFVLPELAERKWRRKNGGEGTQQERERVSLY